MACDTSEMLTIFYYAKIAKNVLFVIVPLIIIVLSVIELFKAVTSGESEDLHEASYNIMKRTILAGILMIIPFFVNLVLAIAGFGTYDECFARATLDNIDKLREKEKAEWELERRRREEEEEERERLRVDPGVHKKTYNGMDYYEIIPPNPKPNMALIIFLHGDGGHSNFDAMKSSAAFKAVENGSLYNGEEFIFIMPKSGPGSAGASDWLSDGIVNKLFGVIDKVSTDYKIDTNRIYLTGHSRGAIATWLLTDKYPNKFAAIMTISGDGNIHPEKFKNIPIRAFAGTYPNDNWAYQGNKANCDRVVSAGGNCTFYPYNTNHGGTPAKAYTKEHINWLLRQKRR